MDADAYLFFGITSKKGLEDSKEIGEKIGLSVEDDGDLFGYGSRLDKERMKPLGLKMGYHCSSEEPMWFICSRHTFKRAWDGHTETINGLPRVPEEQRTWLTRWAEMLGWESPRWILATHKSW